MSPSDQAEHTRALERFKVTAQAETSQRKRELEDLKFADPIEDTDQWPADALSSRAGLPAAGSLPAVPARPALTINELKQPIQQVQQQQRLARLGVEFTPEGADASLDDAEVFEDIARAIQTDSRAHLARNWAFDRMLKCGRGFYRLETDYVNDLTFDQKIVYRRIKNQFCVYFYPFCQEPDFSDAEWCFITADMPWPEYKRVYKDSALASVDDEELTAIGDEHPGWIAETDEGKTVRIAEYYYFDHIDDTLVAIQTDRGVQPILKSTLGAAYDERLVVDGPDGKPMMRPVTRRQLCWGKLNAVEFIDGTEERDGKYIPVVPVIGDESNINGDTRYTGIVRPAIHAQRLFNVEASSLAEAVHLGPIAPFIGYAEQFEGYESWWGQLNTRRFPYLPVNPARDPASGILPLPQRNTAEQPIQAIMVSLQQARQYVHDTTGIPPVALGQLDPSNHSGKAILALQKQSELGTSGYLDNLAGMSLTLEGKILRDLIPIVYGQKGRMVPAEGKDDERRMIPIGVPFNDPKSNKPRVIDLEKGQYGVVGIAAKSNETRRQANQEGMMQLAGAAPELLPKYADLLVGSMDFPEAQQIADRLKPPGEGEMDPAQAQQMMAQMQQQMAELQQLADKNKTDLMKAQMTVQADAQTKQMQAQVDAQLQQQKEQAENQRTALKIEADERAAALDNLVKLAIAEIQAQSQQAQIDAEQARTELGFQQQAHAQTHESSEAERERQHASGEAERDRETQTTEAERDRQASAEQPEA